MATIANLAVGLVADTSKFAAGMSKATKSTKYLRDSTKMATRSIQAMKVASMAAAAGLAVMVKRQFESIDKTSKLADVLGLSTQELVGLQRAAKLGGVEIGQLNTGLTRMLKNIEDSNQGLTSSTRAFEALGLSSQRLASMSTDEAFKAIAESLRAIENPSVRAAASLQLFGRSGIGIQKIAEMGAEGIGKMQQEAVRLGIAFNRVDGAKIEAANDAIATLGDALTGVTQTLAIQLAPAISQTAGKIIKWVTAGDNMKSVVESVITALKLGATALAGFAASMAIQTVTGYVNLIIQGTSALLKFATAATAVKFSIKGVIASMGPIGAVIAAASVAFALFGDEIAGATRKGKDFNIVMKATEEVVQSLEKAATAAAVAQRTAFDSSDDVAALRQRESAIRSQLEALETVTSESLLLERKGFSSRGKFIEGEKTALAELVSQLEITGSEIVTVREKISGQGGGRLVDRKQEVINVELLRAQLIQQLEALSADIKTGQAKIASETSIVQSTFGTPEEVQADMEELMRIVNSAAADSPVAGGVGSEDSASMIESAMLTENEKISSALADRIAIYQEFGLNEQELEAMQYEEKLNRLNEFLENKTLTEQEHQEALLALDEQTAATRMELQNQSQIAMANSYGSAASSILSAVSAFGKKSVKLQKAISLAEAGVSIASGIAKAQALGFPANIAEAARVAAVGAGVISTIRSANVGSSGNVSPAAGSSPSGSSAPAPTVNKNFNVNIAGSSVSKSDVRSLIKKINDETDDNTNLSVR